MFFRPVMDISMRVVSPLMVEHLARCPEDAPRYATEGAAGMDVRACLRQETPLYPGDTLMVGSGIAVHIADPNVAGLLIPRSGLGKDGIVLANTMGLLDSDYQGEICMALFNRSDRPFLIRPFERLAQWVVLPIIRARLVPVDEFAMQTERGAGGFGHTGVA